MRLLLISLCGLITTSAAAQVGIGTTTPNSTLDVQGSVAAKVTISSATSNTLGSEYNFIYTGTSAATVTLPDATAIDSHACDILGKIHDGVVQPCDPKTCGSEKKRHRFRPNDSN